MATRLTPLFRKFFESEKAGGLILVTCTIISIILSNSSFSESYHAIWQKKIGAGSIEHWINDGLMTIFFLLIGLELEREIYKGELSNIKNAMLPVFSAVGGMLVPAGLYLLLNAGTATQSGAGIPMATDIAFALGILSLLGNRVPASLKVFLTALAVIDDLGAILVIALFYSKGIIWTNLIISLGIWVVLLGLNRLKIKNLIPYIAGGIAMWWYMLHSGVHATITGVLLAFAIPFGSGDKRSTSYILQHFLHKPVAFLILPIFALANTAVDISADMSSLIKESYTLGIALGLVIGKPLGIFLLAFIAVKTKICRLPGDINWKLIAGTGFLGGIGFTMSIFIALLAFDHPETINNTRLAILLSSLIAGTLGFFLLKLFLGKKRTERL
ncbi:MAG TPA: Na+/H+ antiporter NhaA [Niabella sp.]|nr:Na+/H+ antiporter NhaA [Niabella sp.]